MRRVVIALCRVACVLGALLLALLVIVDRRVAYFQSDLYMALLPNAALLAIWCALLLTILMVARRRKSPSHAKHFSAKGHRDAHTSHRYAVWCAAASVALLVFQVLAYRAIRLNTGWDVHEVTSAAITPVNAWPERWFVYFSRYPNNLLLLWFLRGADVLRGMVAPGMSPYMAFALCACAASSLSFFLFTRVAKRVMGTEGWAAAASGLYLLLVGVSPWYMIPYSDTFGLLFCTVLLWCFTCGKNPFTRWLLPSALVVVGFRLKPTIVFVYVACVVATLLTITWDASRRRGAVVACLCVACGAGLGVLGTRGALATLDVELSSESQFTMAHYLMMGLNEETNGAYLDSDVDFSASQPTVRERDRADVQLAYDRLIAYGPAGFARHMVRKLLYTMNDGTFSWGAEGGFYVDMTVGEGPVARVISQTYDTDGSLYPLFRTVQQFLWLITLLGIPLILMGMSSLHEDDASADLRVLAVLLASLVALVCFHLVFETRARYLYLYGGYFVLASMLGYRALARSGNSVSFVARGLSEPSRAHSSLH